MGFDFRLERYPLKEISTLYSESLAYHTFNHALNVAEHGLVIANRCKHYGIPVRTSVVVWSCLLHDAGYHLDPKSRGFPTREDHSAHLAKLFLTKRKLPRLIIDEVVSCIISTHRDAPFLFVEQKIVRAADLWELAGDYPKFKQNTFKLKEEYETIHNKKISLQKWLQESKKIIEFYLSESIMLTPEYFDKRGNSVFHLAARKNLTKLMREYRRDYRASWLP